MDKSGADSTSTWLGRTHFSRSICYRFNSGAFSSPSLALLQDFASASIARRSKGYIKLDHDDQSQISQDDLSLHENSLSSSPHHTSAHHEDIHGSSSGAAEPSQDRATRTSSFRRRSISVGSGLDSMTSAKADPDQQYCACDDHSEYSAGKIGEDGESDVARAASWSEYFMPQGNESAVEEAEDWMINLSDLFLGHRFASGAYSRLYLGKYKGEEVAVKVLRQPEDSEEISRRLEQQFRCEVGVLSRVHHRNIIKFIGACKKPPVCCILTEYLPSGSVRAYLHNHLPFSPSLDMVIAMALDIAQGMEYLHSQGVIHRDLKSENLLLADDLCVKITDFGVACFESEIASMTEEVGTYRWMAPEMIKSKHFSRKADVYSFGIVLWELLTGHIPFEELSPVQAAFAVVHKHARPPLPLACPSALGHLMHQCWSADPGKRPEFSKVVEVLENLKASAVLDRSMSIIQRRHRHNHSILRCFGCGLRKDTPVRSEWLTQRSNLTEQF